MLTRAGFSLIEMLIICVIVAIVVAIAIPKVADAKARQELTWPGPVLSPYLRTLERVEVDRFTARGMFSADSVALPVPPAGVRVARGRADSLGYFLVIDGDGRRCAVAGGMRLGAGEARCWRQAQPE